MPAPPTQTQFGQYGVAQMDPYNFNLGQTPPDDRALEPVANIPQMPVPAQATEQPLADQSSGNKTLDYLRKHDPDAAALVDPENGVTVRDAYGVHLTDRRNKQAADQLQANLDQYTQRDQIGAALLRAPPTARQATKDYYDALTAKITHLERQKTALAPPDSIRTLQMRAEMAGLQPGTQEYQDFMASDARAAGGWSWPATGPFG